MRFVTHPARKSISELLHGKEKVVPLCTTVQMMTMDDRWGRVRSVVTLRDVAMGEELLVDYGYDLIR